ncbi:hypothetical protein LCGC14_1721480 [marine sediment metagenome]|uniref:Uncharacterized protein n=1 Tax=marine sediment metagenome TaxID=412755 RepID=A0A0F9HC28_9ZZZZ
MNVGNSWAILQGRRQGDKARAASHLNSMSPATRKERNRQDAKAKGSKRSKKPYRLGESVRVKTRK